MVWPSWLWIGTPLKFFIWLGNRLLTWTGLYYVWTRFRSRRDFWLWFILINLTSMGGLILLLFWLHTRASGHGHA